MKSNGELKTQLLKSRQLRKFRAEIEDMKKLLKSRSIKPFLDEALHEMTVLGSVSPRTERALFSKLGMLKARRAKVEK